MPLSYQVADLGDVPESLREHYAPDAASGQFRLICQGIPDAPNLKSALAAQTALNKGLKALGNPEQIEAALAAARGQAENFHNLMRQSADAWAIERAQLVAAVGASNTAENDLIRDTLLSTSFKLHGLKPELADISLQAYQERVGIENVDGRRRMVIFAKKEQGRYSEPYRPWIIDGRPANVSDLISELAAEAPAMFCESVA
jgi:hypothetical protein